MGLRFAFLSILAAACSATNLWAGGSGLNVVVVVNQNSTNSIQLANAYCEQRCVPPQNVLRLTNQWSGGSVYCVEDEFQNELCAPLLAMLSERGLTNQIEFVLLSMDLPYYVVGTNGINGTTSALFYGFKPDTVPPPGLPVSCSLPDDSFNSYAFSELPFAEGAPDTAATNSFLAVMLTDSNGLAGAELILDRGVAGDSSFPAQPVYLEKTADTARNVRFYEFDNAVFETRIHGGHPTVRTTSDSTSFTNLLGLETGLTDFDLPTNAYVPGAIADNLTSFGGYLLVNSGQTPLLAFLDAGASGSYGTVVEPCNYLQKFPNPLDYFYQARGFCLAEAYYQSIQNPYQGVMVGEPLSAPFALRGEGIWNQPPAGAVLSGATNLQLEFSAAAANLPLNHVDLFVDGTWFATITNLPPAAGDVLSVTLNGFSNSYVVPGQATLASAASGLADVLNSASSNTLVRATAYGDRIELQSTNAALPGAGVSLSAGTTNAAAPPATFLTPALPVFLDSIATGWHNLLVSNAPSVGDWLQLVVEETNGNNVTLAVTNTTSGASIGQFLQVLYNGIWNTPALLTSSGVYPDDFDDESSYGFADFDLYAQSPGWAAAAIQVTLNASSNLEVMAPATSLLQDNLSDLEPRNHLYVTSGALSLPVNWTLDTTQLQDGYHELTAVAYEGTSVRTQTRVSRQVRIQNSGLSASLNTLVGGANTDAGATLQFSVTVNTNNVKTVELFSTGGLLGVVSNQAPAYFSVAGTNLGIGSHPFYAVVTGVAGNQYRTSTTWIDLIGPEPPFAIAASDPPLTLSWSCTARRSYNVLMATNILGPFQTAATITPSNSAAVWVDTNAYSAERFYRVEASY
ncbi:MAG: TIGR03790 family protein [Limisphaerales bacterium]